MARSNLPLPAIVFSISLGILALGFALSQPSSDLPFCSADEKQLVLCIRNWLNSGGNLLGLVVATFAAAFALRQARAAKQQASAALYDVLKERVSQASKAYRLVDDVISQHYWLIHLLKRMQQYVRAGVVNDTLSSLAAEIAASQDNLTKKRNKLKRRSKSLGLFADISACVINIAHDGYEIAMNDCGIAFRSIRNVSLSARTEQKNNSINQLRKDLIYIDRSIIHLEIAQKKMALDRAALEQKGGAANDRLLKLLGLPTKA